ncbi:hypothetical protein Droror1_Dr00010650 [Drosera rotundifolia]
MKFYVSMATSNERIRLFFLAYRRSDNVILVVSYTMDGTIQKNRSMTSFRWKKWRRNLDGHPSPGSKRVNHNKNAVHCLGIHKSFVFGNFAPSITEDQNPHHLVIPIEEPKGGSHEVRGQEGRGRPSNTSPNGRIEQEDIQPSRMVEHELVNITSDPFVPKIREDDFHDFAESVGWANNHATRAGISGYIFRRYDTRMILRITGVVGKVQRDETRAFDERAPCLENGSEPHQRLRRQP